MHFNHIVMSCYIVLVTIHLTPRVLCRSMGDRFYRARRGLSSKNLRSVKMCFDLYVKIIEHANGFQLGEFN